jgi:hypothetical protein
LDKNDLSNVTVLYITGFGRSGSTLLGNILGQLDGFFHVGELWYLWDRGMVENRLCGCGTPFESCKFWQEILSKSANSPDKVDIHKMIYLREHGVHVRHIPRMLLPILRSHHSREMQPYTTRVKKLYRTIAKVSGCNIIVDSSKYPSYGYMLSALCGLNVKFLHLVRDPRGVAFSWLRKKRQPDTKSQTYIRQFNPFISTSLWILRNVAAHHLGQLYLREYRRVRYEDFIEDPRMSISAILRSLDLSVPRMPFIRDTDVSMHSTHTVSGNPMRLEHGDIQLKLDDEWKQDIGNLSWFIVTSLAWSLLLTYKYPIWDGFHNQSL